MLGLISKEKVRRANQNKLRYSFVLLFFCLFFTETTDASENYEKQMENNMNASGYQTYCNTVLNNDNTINIVMVSAGFKDNVTEDDIDNYIGAAVAAVGRITSKMKQKARKLIIKIGFGRQYEILAVDCRKVVQLFNEKKYQASSDYLFSRLKRIK